MAWKAVFGQFKRGLSMIESDDEWHELSRMADTAEECLTSLRFGSHWLLKQKLRKHGISNSSREADIKSAKKLCDEYLSRKKYGDMA